MLEVDEGHKALEGVVEIAKGLRLSDANEAETRKKVIDRVLENVLGWEEDDISYEERVSEDGETTFADYILRIATGSVLVEAKRIGADFTFPYKKRTLKLGGAISEGAVGEAIRQARDYCRKKSIPFAVVTNGDAWIVFPAVRTDGVAFEESYARVFPSLGSVAEQFVAFWELLSKQRVIEGNLANDLLGTQAARRSKRAVINLVPEPGFRLGRNTVYDYIEKAVQLVFPDEALLTDPFGLEYCYVKSSERVKYDSRLRLYLGDSKPPLEHRSRRLRSRRNQKVFDQKLDEAEAGSSTQRLILLLGPVGAGKSTFLQHTRLVSARESIDGKILWFYVDFKAATEADNPRAFILDQLLELIESDDKFDLGGWETSIQPAYAGVIETLKRGPLFLLAQSNPLEFDSRVAEEISKQREQVEPYVTAILRHALKAAPGYLVVDNVDQIEDEDVQGRIFSEAQVIARRIGLHLIFSLRESTYLKHRNRPMLDAFELDSFYVDPPSVLAVLSKRLSYAKRILEGRKARIPTETGKVLDVQDLGAYFEILISSLLSDEVGFALEALSGGDIRRGLSIVRQFLASGHVSADYAMQQYLIGEAYKFPHHEFLRAVLLGRGKYYRDRASLVPNIFDAKLESKELQTLRLRCLANVVGQATLSGFVSVQVEELLADLVSLGISTKAVMSTLLSLVERRVLRTADGLDLTENSALQPTRFAGYLVRKLSGLMAYVECCMYDTVIYDDSTWEKLQEHTEAVESCSDRYARVPLRVDRLHEFLAYLTRQEEAWIVECKRRKLGGTWVTPIVASELVPAVKSDADRAIISSQALAKKAKNKARKKGGSR